MRVRYGQHKGFLEQELDMQLVIVQGQREYTGIEPALTQLAQDHFSLFFDQQKLQLREAFVHARHHVW